MSTANKLTFLRIFLAFICIGLVLTDNFLSLLLAFIVFCLASLTDVLDGFLARRNSSISDLGKIIDPLADKILVIGVLCAFLELGIINSWMVIAIMFREFIVTGLRLYGLSKGIVLEAKRLGKHKTISQVLGIVIIFVTLILAKVMPASQMVFFLYQQFIPLLMWYIVIITLFSGIYYFWVNRKAIRTF